MLSQVTEDYPKTIRIYRVRACVCPHITVRLHIIVGVHRCAQAPQLLSGMYMQVAGYTLARMNLLTLSLSREPDGRVSWIQRAANSSCYLTPSRSGCNRVMLVRGFGGDLGD